MTVDERLASQAREAAAQITARQRDLDAARDGFVRAVRALYLGGGSMREIAEVLGLSHQRVHQLLDLPREPAQRGKSRTITCSFCDRDQTQVRKLIAGPGVGICNDCVGLAAAAAARRAPVTDPRTTVLPVPGAGRCAFCGKASGEGTEPVTLVTAEQPDAVVCTECLDLCREILATELP